MRLHQYFEDISLTPYRNELKSYRFADLNKDLIAGISVALLTLPQAMAYALVAGLPLSTSLFAAIFSCIIASMFGSSRHLIVGPSNAIAILIQYSTGEILYNNFRDLTGIGRDFVALQIMTQMTLIVAIIQLLAVGLKLGRLTQFVSYSVVLGYVTGAIAAIVIGQLFVFLGIPNMEGVHSLCVKTLYLATHLTEVHWATFLVGILSFLIMLLLKKWDKRIPAALLTLLMVTGALYFARFYLGGEADNVMVIGDAGEISGLTPQFMMPHFNFKIMNNLIPFAFAVALLSILETSSVAKSIASFSGQRLSVNQEILGLGLGNLTSAIIGAMPISGSTSRTSLNYESGAQTRLAAIFGSVLVGVSILMFDNFLTKIPLATLSALIFVTVGGILKKKQLLLCLKSTKSDALVFWITFLSCLFFGIDVAFYMGVSLSITLYLKKAAVPQVLQYIVDESGRIKSLEFCTDEEMTKIRFIKVKGELFFGAADLFQTTLKSIAEDDTNTKVIILQLKNARDIDATACLALLQLYDYLNSSNRHLIISGITLPVWEVMSDSGIVKTIGKENLFLIDERNPNLYFNKALKRANDLIGISEKKAEIAAELVIENKPEVPINIVPEPASS
jgi:SulP family sulfate permease